MKKTIVLIAMLCSLNMLANDVTPGIIVNKSDGSSISLVTSQLKSIKFGEGTMIVNMKDNSQQVFTIADIATITFDDISTAIRTLIKGNAGDGTVCISNTSGRVVYCGKTASMPSQHQLPAGIYVVTVNGKSCKVMIK